jgi:hypothetical protein
MTLAELGIPEDAAPRPLVKKTVVDTQRETEIRKQKETESREAEKVARQQRLVKRYKSPEPKPAIYSHLVPTAKAPAKTPEKTASIPAPKAPVKAKLQPSGMITIEPEDALPKATPKYTLAEAKKAEYSGIPDASFTLTGYSNQRTPRTITPWRDLKTPDDVATLRPDGRKRRTKAQPDVTLSPEAAKDKVHQARAWDDRRLAGRTTPPLRDPMDFVLDLQNYQANEEGAFNPAPRQRPTQTQAEDMSETEPWTEPEPARRQEREEAYADNEDNGGMLSEGESEDKDEMSF